MQASLSFINRQGVYRGAAAALEVALDAARKEHPVDCNLSVTMASELITFVRDSELLIAEGDRAWLSTENFASFFGRYKRLDVHLLEWRASGAVVLGRLITARSRFTWEMSLSTSTHWLTSGCITGNNTNSCRQEV